jgi:peptidoglycan/LPS O-acetylase OafA/YrhL
MNHMHRSLRYRPEIDGLRAIAVLAVVLFHYFPKTFASGYLGVDLFFVISGFLITSILYSELEGKRFSLLNFWFRRVIRLIPALLIVLFAVLIAGWLILLPSEYITLGKHVFSSSFFFQNFVLWREVGYFDTDAIQKPLLHMWSLSIEEQFYIMWPIVLLLFFRINKLLLLSLIGCGTLSSIVFMFHFDHATYPGYFYLPFGRIWELSSGGMLAYVMHFYSKREDQPKKKSVLLLNVCFGISLIAIFAALFIGHENASHEAHTVFLVSATLAIIAFSEKKATLKRLLSFPLFTYIGKISYPLYLFHWPLLSISIIQFGDIGLTFRVWLIALSFVLASLTYHFVELPIQKKAKASENRIYPLCLLVALLCVGALAAKTYYLDGLKHRFEFDISKIEEALSDWKAFNDPDRHNIKLLPNIGVISNTEDAPEILFVGDSFAVQYFPKVMYLTREGRAKNVAFLTEQGCFPIKGFRSNSAPCGSFSENATAVLEHNKSIKTVVVALAWNRLCDVKTKGFGIDVDGDIQNIATGEYGKTCYEMFAELIDILSAKHTVYVVASQPSGPQFDPSSALYSKEGARRFPVWQGSNHPVDGFALSSEFKQFESDFAKMIETTNARVIWTSEFICPAGICYPFTPDGNPKYHDAGHFRSTYVISDFEALEKIISKQ